MGQDADGGLHAQDRLSATVISHMMADTTYMTGREAIDKGFADELIEDAEPTSIAASADGAACS